MISKTKFLLPILAMCALCIVFFSGCIGQSPEETVTTIETPTTVAPATTVPTVTDCGIMGDIEFENFKIKSMSEETATVLKCMSDKILSCEKAKLVRDDATIFRVEGKEGDVCKLSLEADGEKKTCKFKIDDLPKIYENAKKDPSYVEGLDALSFIIGMSFAPEGDKELIGEDGVITTYTCDRGPMT